MLWELGRKDSGGNKKNRQPTFEVERKGQKWNSSVLKKRVDQKDRRARRAGVNQRAVPLGELSHCWTFKAGREKGEGGVKSGNSRIK